MAYDIEMRMVDEEQMDPHRMFDVNEYTEGPVFKDDLVEVSALRVVHPPVETYALKLRSGTRTVVFVGDTSFFPPLAEFAKGADVLVHEIMHRKGTDRIRARLREIKPNLMSHMVVSARKPRVFPGMGPNPADSGFTGPWPGPSGRRGAARGFDGTVGT